MRYDIMIRKKTTNVLDFVSYSVKVNSNDGEHFSPPQGSSLDVGMLTPEDAILASSDNIPNNSRTKYSLLD